MLQNSCSHKYLYGRNLQFADQTNLNEANLVKTSLQSNALNSNTDLNHCQIFPQQFMQNSQMFKCPASFQILQEISCSTNLDAKESKFHCQLFKKCINRWLVVQKCLLCLEIRVYIHSFTYVLKSLLDMTLSPDLYISCQKVRECNFAEMQNLRFKKYFSRVIHRIDLLF